jgi:hypothetical protein
MRRSWPDVAAPGLIAGGAHAQLYPVRRMAWLLLLAIGCTDHSRGNHAPTSVDGSDVGGGGGATADGGSVAGGGGGSDPGLDAYVYAHDAATLYKVDPDTLALSMVGPFAWPNGVADMMTDIAIDKNGKMVGVSFDKVYSVDKSTAACTYLSSLDRSFNSLSFVAAGQIDSSGNEVLVAAALDGWLYRIDPASGQSTPIGQYGGGMTSSGDIVSVGGFGTVATVKQPGSQEDWLVSVDAATGAATVLGNTQTQDIWGLGFWKNKIFGFTQGGVFVLLDAKTGAATVVQTGQVHFWGAAVSTAAPVVM